MIDKNGKHLDTATGTKQGGHAHATAHNPVQSNRRTRVLDGFVRVGKAAKSSASTGARKQQRAQTLMRTAVKKPAAKPKVTATAAPFGTQAPARTSLGAKPTMFPGYNDSIRAERAKAIPKSNLVRKFSDFGVNTKQNVQQFVRRTEPMPVVQPAPQLDHHTQPVVQPRPGARAVAQTAVAAQPAIASRSQQMMQRALQNATSHEQTLPIQKSRKPRSKTARRLGISTKIITISAACLAILLLGGFFAYQNVPNFAMRVAATRSGVAAGLPTYRPSGFAIKNPIRYTQGEIKVAFHSTTGDSRGFTISQKTSDWNSDTLLSNFVLASKNPYQTYQDSGRTIYIYNGNNATWVNGGIWYNISSADASLSSDQLIRIATSM
jgi:hypothetical protein